MTSDDARDAAIGALAAREYERAGDEYTRAGWCILADPHEGQDTFTPDEKGWVGVGLGHLVTAAVAYRVAGRRSRATRRAVAGVATARDLEHALDHPVQHACLREVVADFRVAGDLDGVTDAYADAAAAYESAAEAVEDPQAWGTTPLFSNAATPLQQVARGLADGEIAVQWEDLHGDDPADPGAFLAHRATYKRQRFPGLVEQAVADGHLAAPRGTTAYATDSHRCPSCDATDVNWVGDSTLCLQCSRPTAER